jgi:ribosomal-protein-alanine N-acetyltransferase
LSDLSHVLSATTYQGFNDGMKWDAPKHQDELIEPFHKSARAWTDGSEFSFTIERKDSGVFLGRISIRKTEKDATWNVGFWTHPEHQGQGIMTEALKAIIDFGFIKLSANKIEACHALWNKPSEIVLKRNHMKFIRHLEKGFLKKGKWVEENLLCIERKDWAKFNLHS